IGAHQGAPTPAHRPEDRKRAEDVDAQRIERAVVEVCEVDGEGGAHEAGLSPRGCLPDAALAVDPGPHPGQCPAAANHAGPVLVQWVGHAEAWKVDSSVLP